MPKKTFTAEQIVAKLRQIEVVMGQGKTVSQAAKEAGITDQTFAPSGPESRRGGSGSDFPRYRSGTSGDSCPNALTVIRVEATPLRASQAATDVPRRWDRFKLYSPC